MSPRPSPELPSAEDLYHRAPCGYLTTDRDGTILLVNRTLLDWTGFTDDRLLGLRFVDLLSPGGRIFHETHFAPLLQLQGEVREIAFDLVCADGSELPVLVNSTVVDAGPGASSVVQTTVFDATLRHEYEQELLHARQRAERSERHANEVALQLQESMLRGTNPSDPSFTLETRYQPADRSLTVGGDWHDAFLLDDGRRLAVSVGDVVGRGIDAACAMGQLRSGLRAVSMDGAGPAAVLDRLDSFAATVPDALMTTVVYAELDLSTFELRYAAAGHPPPVLRRGDHAELLWEGRRLPLDVADSWTPTEGRTELEPGDGLLLYTDGLIERRGRDINDGLSLLTRTMETPGVDAKALADAVLDAMVGPGGVADDVCLLYVERCPEDDHAEG